MLLGAHLRSPVSAPYPDIVRTELVVYTDVRPRLRDTRGNLAELGVVLERFVRLARSSRVCYHSLPAAHEQTRRTKRPREMPNRVLREWILRTEISQQLRRPKPNARVQQNLNRRRGRRARCRGRRARYRGHRGRYHGRRARCRGRRARPTHTGCACRAGCVGRLREITCHPFDWKLALSRRAHFLMGGLSRRIP